MMSSRRTSAGVSPAEQSGSHDALARLVPMAPRSGGDEGFHSRSSGQPASRNLEGQGEVGARSAPEKGGNMIGGTTIQDIPVGLKARFSKTVGESDVYLFAG